MDKINCDPCSQTLPVSSVPRKVMEPLHKMKPEAEKAAEQFETLLALQLVRTMQSSLESGTMFGGGVAGDVYNGLAEWELARVLAKSAHFGLKEQILRQLPAEEDR